MSVESSTGASVDQPAPRGARGPGRWRKLPRKALIIGGAAVIVVAVLAATVIVVAGKPASGAKLAAQHLRYTSLPAPCAMLASATVTRYLPGATSSRTNPPSTGANKVGACTWSSISDGENRTLLLQVDVYGSSSGLTSAEHAYAKGASPAGCGCTGYKVAQQPVTGLGDQAAVLFTTSTAVRTGSWNVPTVTLTVRSGNADVTVSYLVVAVGKPPAPPTNAALLTATIAMARDVLAALAR